jgi:hypothetical protein
MSKHVAIMNGVTLAGCGDDSFSCIYVPAQLNCSRYIRLLMLLAGRDCPLDSTLWLQRLLLLTAVVCPVPAVSDTAGWASYLFSARLMLPSVAVVQGALIDWIWVRDLSAPMHLGLYWRALCALKGHTAVVLSHRYWLLHGMMSGH